MPLEAGFDGLARELVAALRAGTGELGKPLDPGGLPELPRVAGLPEFVLESETGLLLGEPPARALSLALPVFGPGAVASAVWALGEDFARAAGGAPQDFLQLLIVQAPAGPSRPLLSRIASLRSLAGRIPGYLAHSVEAETTARVHRGLLAAGFSQRHLARAHLAQLRERGFEGPALVAVGLVPRALIERLDPFWERLRGLRAQVAAAAASEAAALDGCEGKSCVSCDERVVCDKVREVLAAQRREKNR